MFPLRKYILVWQEQKSQFPLIARPSPSVWPVTYEASGDAKLRHPKSTSESLPVSGSR